MIKADANSLPSFILHAIINGLSVPRGKVQLHQFEFGEDYFLSSFRHIKNYAKLTIQSTIYVYC